MTETPDFETVLRELELYQVAEGDQVLMPVRRGVWLNDDLQRVEYCMPDGTPMRGTLDQQTLQWGKMRQRSKNFDSPSGLDPELFMKTRLRWMNLDAIINTSWIGINMAVLGGPPLIWETMIATDAGWTDLQWRYATQNAAKIAHRTIVDVLVAAGMTEVDLLALPRPQRPTRELDQ